MILWLVGINIVLFVVSLFLLFGYIHYSRQVRAHSLSRAIVEKRIEGMTASLSFLADIQIIQQTKSTVFVPKGSGVIFRCPTPGCNHWCDNLNFCPECQHHPDFSMDERDLISSIPSKFAKLAALQESLRTIK